VHTLPPLVARTDKPIVAVVDAGRLYDAMAAGLMDRGVCVFRNVARGTRALVRHVEARLDAERIRAISARLIARPPPPTRYPTTNNPSTRKRRQMMSETLQPGLSLTRKYDIDTARTIAFMGDDLPRLFHPERCSTTSRCAAATCC
jgi:hypothetical protein